MEWRMAGVRKCRPLTAAIVALSLAVAACTQNGGPPPTSAGQEENASVPKHPSSTSDGAAERYGGTLTIGVTSDPTGFTANTTAAVVDSQLSRLTYETLVVLNRQGVPEGRLASDWSISEDGRVYTFNLVDAEFSDGVPMTSEDVKYSLLNVSAEYSPHFGTMKDRIDAIETPSPTQVVIRLKEPFGPFLSLLATGGQVLPSHLYEGTDPLTNPATIEAPVGTGPFVLEEWVRGSHLRYIRNERYWQEGLPYLDEVVVRVIPTPSQRVLGLLSEELDWIDQASLPQSDYATVEGKEHLNLVDSSFPPLNELLHFNVRRGPTADPAVRKALVKAIDREFIIESAFFGAGSPGVNAIDQRLVWAHDPSTDYRDLFPYDPEVAAAELDAAGYPVGANGTRFTLHILAQADIAADSDTAAAIAQMWREIGVDAVYEALDRATVTERTYSTFDFDVRVGSYSTQGDPNIGVARAYVTASIGTAFGNASGYSVSEVDKAFEDAGRESNPEVRKQLYAKAAARIAEDMPVFLLVQKINYDGWNRRVHGHDTMMTPDYAAIWVEQ